VSGAVVGAGRRLSALGDWLDAADPGALRRHHAGRTALASLTAWVTIHLAILWLAGRPMPGVGLYAVTVCFIDALIIVDARRAERRLTLLLSLLMFALALLLATLMQGLGWLYLAVLLGLIFGSYAIRRRGLRPGELVLVLTMGLYFAEGSRVTWANLAWFSLATFAGVGSLWLWQFVLLPYDPTRSLHDSIRAFYLSAASVVGAVATELDDRNGAMSDEDLPRRLRRVKLSRRAIESQFPGVLAPGGWTQAEIGQMQLALYATERGLTQMVEGASERSALAEMRAELRAAIGRSISSLQEALRTASPESMQALAGESATLQTQVRAMARSASGEARQETDGPLAPWIVTALRLIGGSHEVARSAGRVRSLAAHEDAAGKQAADRAGAGPGKRPAAPALVTFGSLHVHPTTALGIQAVVATGAAMVVARLLNVDHSNWVFWTAFVVIAGSTGESLRKMMLRVAGTVGGATIGVALALLLPDSTALIVTLATVCIFLSIYAWPISYPLMVFWINIGFVIVYTLLGARALDLLLARPVTTLLGALVAALVVVFVFPIRTADRFKTAAAQFLDAVDGYVAAFVDTMSKAEDQAALDAAQARIAATYAQVEQMLPGVAFENNPLMQAQSAWTQPATQLAALDAEVARLAGATGERTLLAGDAPAAAWMRTVQARIHFDIQALILLLRSDRRHEAAAEAVQEGTNATTQPQEHLAPARLPVDDGQGQFRTGGGMTLLRIQDIIAQLVAQLGAPAASMPN
jgi:uncharacterized membrane protein YccC